MRMIIKYFVLGFTCITLCGCGKKYKGTDQFGDSFNYGRGVFIKETGVYWAPVNCGSSTLYPYGLLYQWGRVRGQSYEAGELIPFNMTMLAGQALPNKDYAGAFNAYFNWFDGLDNSLWLEWSRGKYDPCPSEWRLPTSEELENLVSLAHVWTTTGGINRNQQGLVFESSSKQVFLPAVGYRSPYGDVRRHGEVGSYWSSTTDDFLAKTLELSSNPSFVEVERSPRAKGCSIRCVHEK